MKITNKFMFDEAQYMAILAVYCKTLSVTPESYWDAAMLALKEAYGK
jgi:hypothetical protein